VSFLAAFLATAAGKWIVGLLGVVVALVVANVKGRLSGAKAERDKQSADQLQAIKDRKDTDDAVNTLPTAGLDSRLSQWMRDRRR
jgi:hypothetical protein